MKNSFTPPHIAKWQCNVATKVLLILIIMTSSALYPIRLFSQQNNLIKNPSFEDRQRTNLYQPYTYEIPIDVSNFQTDELTKCIGDYTLFQTNPVFSLRPLLKSQGGCDGWYNPHDENESTPDYFNRACQNINYQNKVDIPDNWYNRLGAEQHKQEPFDDNNNSIVDSNSSEDAYVGIWNKRIWNNFETNNNYSEYITQRFGDLNQPYSTSNKFLQKNTGYNVKFRVSWSTGLTNQNQDYQTGQYLKGIGAYFSADNPFDGPRWNQTILDIDDHNPNLVLDHYYFTNPTYYNQTGGANGTNWMTIENNFQPAEDLNFITIGDFQGDWSIDNRIGGPTPSNNDEVMVYYFVDAVEVTPIENFECRCSPLSGGSCYMISAVPKLKELGTYECCFDIYLNVYKVWDMCHISKAKIYYKDDQNNNIFVSTFSQNNEYFHLLPQNPILIYENLCFNETSSPSKRIVVELYQDNDNTPKCVIDKDIVVQCPCSCETELPPNNLLNVNFINYTQSVDKQQCCWDIELKNESDCKMSVDEIYFDVDLDKASGISLTSLNFWNYSSSIVSINGVNKARYSFSNPNIENTIDKNSQYKIGRICIDWGISPLDIRFTYSSAGGVCEREITLPLLCQDCCEKIHVSVNPIPSYDDGTSCCFTVNLTIDEGFQCGANKIRIFTENNVWLFDGQSNSLPEGLSSHVFCVNKSVFGSSQSIGINIQILNNDGEILCPKTATINACTQLPVPCYPDNPSISWNGPKSKQVTVTCPPYPPCTVDISYLWRTVTNGNSVSQRDIQVTSFSFPTGCQCTNEQMVSDILEYIWNDPDVITDFLLSSDPKWQNDVLCDTNFRVVSSDCWEAFTQEIGNIHKKKCNDLSCCYAMYRVCYYKDNIGDIKYLPDSFYKLSNSYNNNQPCQSPCLPNGCDMWAPTGTGQVTLPRINTDDFSMSNKNCNVFITSNKVKQELMLNLECDLMGKVSLRIIDLLGNEVHQQDFPKNGFTVSVPLDSRISSGIYLIRVTIDNQLMYNGKINIVR